MKLGEARMQAKLLTMVVMMSAREGRDIIMGIVGVMKVGNDGRPPGSLLRST